MLIFGLPHSDPSRTNGSRWLTRWRLLCMGGLGSVFERRVRYATICGGFTANVMEAEVQQCRDAGMDGFIPKPFKQAQLVEAIRTALGR